MALFRYEAVARSGEFISGTLEGRSADEIVAKLQAAGHLPIDASENATRRHGGLFARQILPLRKLPVRDFVILTRELASLLQAGVALDRSLEILVRLTGRQQLRELLHRIRERVRDGAGLAEAMEEQGDVYPATYVSLVRAGEASGSLEQVLGRLADHLARVEAVQATLRAALLYPVVLLCMSAASIVLVLTVVVPEFEPIFLEAGAKLPSSAEFLLTVSHLLTSYWPAALVALLVTGVIVRLSLRQARLRETVDRWLLRLPLVGPLIAKTETARLCRTAGTLFAGGLPLPASLALARSGVANRSLSAAVQDVVERVQEGAGLARSLARTGVVPGAAVQLIEVGEESGRLASLLTEVADIFDRETQRTIEGLVAALVPTLTIGLGAIIALIIAVVLSAVLSVNELAL